MVKALLRRLMLWFEGQMLRRNNKIVAGVPMVLFVDDDKVALLEAKLEASLRLIRDFDPRRFARMQRLVRYIWVWFTVPWHLAEWREELGACRVNDKYALHELTLPEDLACTLVHEVTHAWLDSLGIRSNGDERRQFRIERICVRAELAFARKLRDRPMAVSIKKRLRKESFYMSRQEHAERTANHLLELANQLLELPKDNWLLRAAAWWIRRQAKTPK